MHHLFGWDLPPGCTDSDCEPYNPRCETCGHFWDEHYEDNDDITQPNERDVIGYDSEGPQRDSDGNITHACDALVNIKSHIQCTCEAFTD